MAVNQLRRAVFLDKDGTLIEDEPYNVDPQRIRLAPGAAAGMKRLHRAGYLLCVVSNQSGVGRGYFPESRLQPVARRLEMLAQSSGARLAGFYYCPHWPEATQPPAECGCRKPAPGLITRAANELSIDLTRSWMVGDILHDVEAGHRAGTRSILIDNGNETEWQWSPIRMPEFFARDLLHASELILIEDEMEAVAG